MDEFVLERRGALEYEVCAGFPAGCAHGFTTRLGGVSQGIWSSLNLGLHRGDDRERVLENYRILGSALGFRPEDTVLTKQLHHDLVARVGRADRGQGLFAPVPGERDGLVTDEPGVALVIFSADCTPVLFYDPVRRAVGGCHAGWRGMALGIPQKTVETMVREFGCKPEHIRAAIGPCIGKCCFETGPEVPAAMVAALGPQAEAAVEPRGEKFFVDLKALAAMWLRQAGVREIYTSPSCTACRPDRFWSHRKVGGERGSQAAVILLK